MTTVNKFGVPDWMPTGKGLQEHYSLKMTTNEFSCQGTPISHSAGILPLFQNSTILAPPATLTGSLIPILDRDRYLY